MQAYLEWRQDFILIIMVVRVTHGLARLFIGTFQNNITLLYYHNKDR